MKNKRLIIIVISVLLGVLAIQCGKKEPYDKIYHKARKCEKKNKIETAIAAYTLILKHYSKSPRAEDARQRLQNLLRKRKYSVAGKTISGKSFYIQTAAIKDRSQAERYLRELQQKLPYLSFRIYYRRPFFKLISQELNSHNLAERFLSELKTLNYDGYIRSSLSKK